MWLGPKSNWLLNFKKCHNCTCKYWKNQLDAIIKILSKYLTDLHVNTYKMLMPRIETKFTDEIIWLGTYTFDATYIAKKMITPVIKKYIWRTRSG